MTRRAIRLIDVLVPPANHWLSELTRVDAGLPPGVRVVRFGDDDAADPSEVWRDKARSRARSAIERAPRTRAG